MVVGCIRIDANSAFEAEMHAIEVELKIVAYWRINKATVFTDCIRLEQMLEQDQSDCSWRLDQRLVDLK